MTRGRRVILAWLTRGVNEHPWRRSRSRERHAGRGSLVGISFQHGADLARESADVLLLTQDLTSLPRAIRPARRTMGRVQGNFRAIAGVSSALIGLGALGVVPPSVSGALHNATTILTSARSLRPSPS